MNRSDNREVRVTIEFEHRQSRIDSGRVIGLEEIIGGA